MYLSLQLITRKIRTSIIFLHLLDALKGTPSHDQRRVTIAHATNFMQMRDVRRQRKSSYHRGFSYQPAKRRLSCGGTMTLASLIELIFRK